MYGRITIESDGTPRNTVIRNAETGEQIRGVRWLKIVMDATDGRAYAVLELIAPLDSLRIDSVAVQGDAGDESSMEAGPPAAS